MWCVARVSCLEYSNLQRTKFGRLDSNAFERRPFRITFVFVLLLLNTSWLVIINIRIRHVSIYIFVVLCLIGLYYN